MEHEWTRSSTIMEPLLQTRSVATTVVPEEPREEPRAATTDPLARSTPARSTTMLTVAASVGAVVAGAACSSVGHGIVRSKRLAASALFAALVAVPITHATDAWRRSSEWASTAHPLVATLLPTLALRLPAMQVFALLLKAVTATSSSSSAAAVVAGTPSRWALAFRALAFWPISVLFSTMADLAARSGSDTLAARLRRLSNLAWLFWLGSLGTAGTSTSSLSSRRSIVSLGTAGRPSATAAPDAVWRQITRSS